MRANKQIWKLAEWLYWNVFDLLYPGCERFCVHWNGEGQEVKDQMYDKAKTLFYMFAYNAFTGPDNHE